MATDTEIKNQPVRSASGAEGVVDLRSDTVTRPTPAMRRAMAEAEVGDDMYGEDPTVNHLQARAAEIFGREAALFVPSGCMGNLIAIKVWTNPGSEVLCESRAHTFTYELSSMSMIAGVMPRTIPAPDGLLTWELIEPHIVQKNVQRAHTGLIEIENTHNLGGGTVYPVEQAETICDRAHELGLPVHLDGARIFNAALASGRTVAEITRKADSVMFCLSKGLGAPVGSMLVGSRDFIDKAWRVRKVLGGSMRQVGVLAAAGLVALEESPKGLPLDHQNARALAEGLAVLPGARIDPGKVVTNIVIFDVEKTGMSPVGICAQLSKRGVLAAPFGKHTIRMVTHYDVNRAGIERALAATREILHAGAQRAANRG
jgi:threonine aldolase